MELLTEWHTGDKGVNSNGQEIALLIGMMWAASAAAQTEVVTYYYTDPQGTVLATADENGNVVNRFDHRPFGEEALGPKAEGPGFTSHVEDTESDYVYMQQRYYDPSIGRFISVDPMPIDATRLHNVARYTYANDNPYLFYDPDGQEALLHWNSPYSVTSTIRYSMTGPGFPQIALPYNFRQRAALAA